MFFQKEENRKVLERFLNIPVINCSNKTYEKRLFISKEIISLIISSSKEWDESCSFNITAIGNSFIENIKGSLNGQAGDDQTNQIYSSSYRFLCEFNFSNPIENRQINNIMDEVLSSLDKLSGTLKEQIVYASYSMPIQILKKMLNDKNIISLSSFETKKEEAEKLKEQWDKEIKEKKQEVDVLKNNLDKYKEAFNFVGLYKAFSQLSLKKEKEAKWLFISLIVMGLIILVPLICELVYFTENRGDIGLDILFIAIPLITLEVILIYFFRVILLNYHSIKAQTLQIDLRKALCQFIHNYTAYSSKIKKEDSVVLEKFESLIFSGLISDSDKLPSTFDGMDQIGNLIKAMKGK